MKWFGGSIPEAIALAKSTGKVFLVFIEGPDDLSKNMSSTYETDAVSTKLQSWECVAIRLLAGSQPCQQFSQIYPVVIIPSTFFIGCNGIPLEIIAGSVTSEEFVEKIEKVMQMEPAVAKENAAVPSNSIHNTLPLEERARRLVEERRIQKLKEDEEEGKARELERCRVSRELQKAQQAHAEEKARKWARKRTEEKEDEELHRGRIQEQIAQGRADRAERYQEENAQEQAQRRETAAKLAKEQQERDAAEATARSQLARIQFRLPDGSSATHTFDADATLQNLHEFVIKTIQPGFSPFSFSIPFPRREFMQEHYSSSLRELQLAPSSVLLIVPTQAVVRASAVGSMMKILWAVFSPVLFLWSLVSSFLFGVPAVQPVSPEQDSPPSTDIPRAAEEQSGARRRRLPQREGRSGNIYQREGNIYRFSNQRSSDDDDDTNTWNGNSTQQM